MVDLSQLVQKPKVVTPERARQLAEAVAYLQSTDWQVIAKYERKRPIPGDVKEKRKQALDIVTAE